MTDAPPAPLRVDRFRDPLTALGAGCHYLARRRPFSAFSAETLIATLDGQARRGHYLAAFEGPKMMGWLGWALLSEEAAERFARTGAPPDAATLARGGEVVWVLTAAAESEAALKALTRAARRMYPTARVMGMRHGMRGSRVLDTRRV